MELHGRITKKTELRVTAPSLMEVSLIATILACISGGLAFQGQPGQAFLSPLLEPALWVIGVVAGCVLCLQHRAGGRRQLARASSRLSTLCLLPAMIGLLATAGQLRAADLESAAGAVRSATTGEFDPAKADLFANYVQPILNQHCTSCHGDKKNKGKLRLHSFKDIMDGAGGDAVITPGDPDDSTLYIRTILEDDDEDRMPPADDGKERLPEAKAAVLKWWIELGAKETTPVASLEVPAEMAAILASLKPVDTAALAAAAKAKAEMALQQAGSLDEISKKLGILALPTYQGSTEVDINALNVAGKFGDEQIAELAALKDAVVNLNLARTQITDDGLATIGDMSNLRVLHLEKTKINGGGFDHLSKLEKLEYLNLYGTEVDDAAIQKLAGIKSLKKLFLFESKATSAGADKLKEQIPGIDINLGVSLTPPAKEEEEPKKEEAATTPDPGNADPVKEQFVKLAKLFDADSCCHKAHAAEGVCKHDCCIAAAKEAKVCLKCNPGAEGKKP